MVISDPELPLLKAISSLVQLAVNGALCFLKKLPSIEKHSRPKAKMLNRQQIIIMVPDSGPAAHWWKINT